MFSSLKIKFRQENRRYAGYSATAPIYKIRMMESYWKASQMAFKSSNIQSGWREAGLWPIDPSKVLPSAEPRPSTPPQHESHDTPPYESPENTYSTPRGPIDLIRQLKQIELADGNVTRDVRNLVGKAAKALATYTSKLARTRRDNEDLRIKLDRYALDVRQPVIPDPNKVFASLPEIRTAQDKRNKRLRELEEPEPRDADEIIVQVDHRRNKRREK